MLEGHGGQLLICGKEIQVCTWDEEGRETSFWSQRTVGKDPGRIIFPFNRELVEKYAEALCNALEIGYGDQKREVRRIHDRDQMEAHFRDMMEEDPG